MNGFNCYSSFIFALRKKYKRRGVDVGSTLHVSNLIQPWIYLRSWPGILKHFKTNTGKYLILKKYSRSAETLKGLWSFQKVRNIKNWKLCEILASEGASYLQRRICTFSLNSEVKINYLKNTWSLKKEGAPNLGLQSKTFFLRVFSLFCKWSLWPLWLTFYNFLWYR